MAARLHVRLVHVREELFVGRGLMHIPDHANHCTPAQIHLLGAICQTYADRSLSGPELSRQSFVDDDGVDGGFRFSEEAALF